jgi:hypothetical protein
MAAGLRAFIANALGFIADERASEALCGCSMSSKNPGDMYPIIQALGRIGGDKAVSCLDEVIKAGEYDTEIVRKDYRYEPRWEAGRFAILASTPEQIGSVKEAFAANKDKTVTAELAKLQPGIDLVESCKADAACYEKTLVDVNADWFAREKAAFEVARLKHGDLAAAEAISKAYKVRNPGARENLAWLPAHMLDAGVSCEGCVTALQGVLDAEKNSMDKTYQAAVIRARETIASLRPAGAEE